jgi:hypothetical protein
MIAVCSENHGNNINANVWTDVQFLYVKRNGCLRTQWNYTPQRPSEVYWVVTGVDWDGLAKKNTLLHLPVIGTSTTSLYSKLYKNRCLSLCLLISVSYLSQE